MIDHVSGVVLRAVDERRLSAAEDWQSDRVQTGRVDHAAVVSQAALAIEDRHMEPAVVGSITCGPDDGSDFAARQIEIEPRGGRYARGLEALGGADIAIT